MDKATNKPIRVNFQRIFLSMSPSLNLQGFYGPGRLRFRGDGKETLIPCDIEKY